MKILFVCKSNVGRSQMAESFLINFAPHHKAFSAGTHVAPENEGESIVTVTDKVVRCMNELGYDVRDKIMNQITPEMVERADKIIAITGKETLPDYLKTSSKLEVWDIPDAGGTNDAFHNKVRDMVKKSAEDLTKRLK